MVELKFNHELSVFTEEEDPLSSSLHLDDLGKLSSHSFNSLRETCENNVDDISLSEGSASSTSRLSIPDLNLEFLMPEDTVEQRDDVSTSTLSVKNITSGSFDQDGTLSNLSFLEHLQDLPQVPSMEEVNILSPVNESKDTTPSDQDDLIEKPNTLEIFAELQIEEEKKNIVDANKETPTLQDIVRRQREASLTKHFHHVDKRSSNDNEGSKRSSMKKDRVKPRALPDYYSSLPIPSLEPSYSDETAILTEARSDEAPIMDETTSEECLPNNPPPEKKSNKIRSKGVKKSTATKKVSRQESDNQSIVSTASSLSQRISDAFTPKWLKKRKVRKLEKKNALLRQRDGLGASLYSTQHSNYNDDDMSIMTSMTQMRNEACMEGSIIMNMDTLKHQQSLHSDCASIASMSTRKSLRSNASKKQLVARPPVLKFESRNTSAPVIKSPRPAGLSRHKRSTSDSPIVIQGRKTMHLERRTVVVVSPKSSPKESDVSVSKQKSSRSFFGRSSSQKQMKEKQQTKKQTSKTSKSKSKTSKSKKSSENTPNTRQKQFHLQPRSGNKLPELIHMSELSPSLRQINTNIANAPHYASHLLKTPPSSRSARLESPSPLSASSANSRSSRHHRHRSLNDLDSNLNRQLDFAGSKYASHLLNTPSASSIGSQHSFHSPSSYQRSLSSFLESPSRRKLSQSFHSDASSVMSGMSFSSTYTALSNLSYHDPLAKPSKIVRRSNLNVDSSKGDGDIWVEKIFMSKRTGKRRIFFVSVATGRRVRDEPPTGASQIVYQDDLKEMKKIEAEEAARQLDEMKRREAEYSRRQNQMYPLSPDGRVAYGTLSSC
ncbi:predicted protein [Chaetoceros tenuissimus]|uniref:Uncharacterized protein n=1 Tax=Chaetoceros tenuissimus TaxID=426638 RepID=A0AAD3CKI2_9STRA|nr:predicted protein [Chaetoceros tenuissimus]